MLGFGPGIVKKAFIRSRPEGGRSTAIGRVHEGGVKHVRSSRRGGVGIKPRALRTQKRPAILRGRAFSGLSLFLFQGPAPFGAIRPLINSSRVRLHKAVKAAYLTGLFLRRRRAFPWILRQTSRNSNRFRNRASRS
ncbi:hypothetical protein BRAO375_890004 [Bradyrhizobium sp. ORS 375]|nr:hypothetical protein BRAO375_890004 [Bradyrhizobium sp. ORS 375]